MKKRNSKVAKKVLSILLAFSLLVSAMTCVFSIQASADTSSPQVWDGTTTASSYAGGSGTSDNPYLISNGAQLRKLVGDASTSGKYYALTNDIYLNDVSNPDWKTSSPNNWAPTSSAMAGNYFYGTFDGKNHTIYGLYHNGNVNQYPGTSTNIFPALFFRASGATFKNLTVSDASLYDTAADGMGSIVGRGNDSSKTITFDCCYVTSSVSIELNRISDGGAGGLIGYGDTKIIATNCAVLTSNISAFTKGSFVGNCWTDNKQFTNCFTSANIKYDNKKSSSIFNGCYGTVAESGNTGSVTVLTDAQMKGAVAQTNMPALDWEYVWETTESGYPVLQLPTNEGVAGRAWSGKPSANYAGGSGTLSDPYLIATPEQLRKMYGEGNNSSGKYYKLTEDIYLNNVSVSGWKENSPKSWAPSTYTQPGNNGAFQGTLDGACHTIYGLYIDNSLLVCKDDPDQINGSFINPGLFCRAKNATIKNLSMSDAYVRSTNAGTNGVAAFIGRAMGPITFDSCYLTDSVNVISTNTTDNSGAGGYVGYGSDNISLTNCASFATVQHDSDIAGAFFGNVYHTDGKTRRLTSCIASVTKLTGKHADNFTNCYGTVSETETGLTVISDAQMKGAAAQTNMPALDWNNVWETTESGYPVLQLPTNEGVAGRAWSGKPAANYAGGSGTEANPYIIETPEQLYKAIKDGTTDTGKYYSITEDLYINNVSNNNWTANSPKSWIDRSGINNTAFSGYINGNGHTIYGLYYNGTSIFGLIPQAANTTVENLKIKNASITSSANAAALIGFLPDGSSGSINVKYCEIGSDVSVTSTGASAGGYIAFGACGSINFKSCSFTGTLSATNHAAAFCADVWGGGNKMITDSFAKGYEFAGNNLLIVSKCYTTIDDRTADGYPAATKISDSDMLGANAYNTMPRLDFDYTWVTTDSYPTIASSRPATDTDEGVAGGVWKGRLASKYAGGLGTSNSPYIIETAEQFALMINSDTEGKHFILNCDILLNASGSSRHVWYDSTNTEPFKGYLDGNGYSIRGLYYDGNATGNKYVGLFPRANGAKIENLTLRDSSIILSSKLLNDTASYAGGFIGFVTGKGCYLNGCLVASDVTISNVQETGCNNKAQVGGLVGGGGNAGASVSDCAFLGTLNYGNNVKYGSIIGDIWGNGNDARAITRSFAKDNVLCAGAFIGGNNYNTATENNKGPVTVIGSLTNKANMPALDWENTWYITDGGYPALRKTAVALCDVTGDGICDSSDLVSIINYLLGRGTLDFCDVNNDMSSNILDLVHAKKAIAGATSQAYTDWTLQAGAEIVASSEFNAIAEKLSTHFNTVYGITPSVVSSSSAQQQIILIVDSSMADGNYNTVVANNSLTISAKDKHTLETAVEAFIAKNARAGRVYAVSDTLYGYTDTKTLGTNTYSYVWGDEFSGMTLDESKWQRRDRMGGWKDLEIDETDKLSYVSDGTLKLKTGTSASMTSSYVAPVSITTKDTMSFKHGYLEIRTKIPFGRGFWPSFWMDSNGAISAKQDAQYTIEVDLFECFASADSIDSEIHKWSTVGDELVDDQRQLGNSKYTFTDASDLSKEFHIYGMEWTSTEIKLYIDGNLWNTYRLNENFGTGDMSGFDTTMYLIMSNHVYTYGNTCDEGHTIYRPYGDKDNPNDPNGCWITADNAESVYEVDYVRLYQMNGDELYTQ